MSPFHLEILMHYLVSPAPFRTDNQTFREYRQYWIETGCIEAGKSSGEYCVTDKGRAWMDKALSTPMPVQKWVWE
jgi:hypothetical protein